jgi:cytochrome c-type biogenesis protein CcmE
VAEVERDPLEISTEEESSGKSHLIRFLLLGVVVALAVGYMVYAAFPGNTRYFLTVSEFMNGEEYQDGQMLRVSGKLVAGSFQRQEDSTVSHFRLTDKTSRADAHMDASYVGVLPDLFYNPHSEIILEGRYGPDNVFEADNILVKCPSKYRSLEQELQQQQLPASG